MNKEIQFIDRPFFNPLFKKSGRLILIFSLLFCSFRNTTPPEGSKISIRFRVYIHGEPLELNKKYKNPFGEIFEISRLRFYVGNIHTGNKHNRASSGTGSSYHLIDLSDTASTFVTISNNNDSFNEIQLQLGIDSIDQCRGAQTGALDPLKGMFWTWNSGYQSIKIEGGSPASGQPAHLLAYHLGGYRYPYSTVWKIKLSAEKSIPVSKEILTHIEIPIELDYFFNGRTPIHIQEISDCMTPGELARNISENFIGSFTGIIITENQ